MQELKINHLAVLVCFVLLTGLGFAWYGPLFGEPWMEMVGIDPENMEVPGAGIWITNIIATIAPLYLLAWLFTKLNVRSALNGGMIGFLISFCFILLSDMTSDMFAGAPYGLAWITGGYSVVAITVSGAILGAWKKFQS